MSETIPEYWEPSAEEVAQPARPLSWLAVPTTMLGVLFVPRRLGPRVGYSSLAKAVFVQLTTGLVVTLGMILVLGWRPLAELRRSVNLGQFTLSEKLRLPGVLVVETLHELAGNPKEVLPALITLPVAHVACWLGAWLLMPFIAADEPNRRTYLRAVKLTFWSTACFLPIVAIVTTILGMWIASADSLWSYNWRFIEKLPPLIVGFALLPWIHFLLRLSARSVPTGGAVPPKRRPLCNECGYVLTGLATDGRCPECGMPVARSLATTRSAPPWATARGSIVRVREYFRTAARIMRRRDFFQTLAVHTAREAAVRFALWTCWVIGLSWSVPIFVAVIVVRHIHGEAIELDFALAVTVGATIFLPTTVAFALTALTTLRACRFGLRDARASTMATVYGTALLLPAAVVASLTAMTAIVTIESGLFDRILGLPSIWRYTSGTAATLVIGAPLVGALIWGLVRYRRALRDVRHAAA